MEKRKGSSLWIPILGILILVLGICAVCYPAFSAWYIDQTKAEVSVEYYNKVEVEDNEKLLAELQAAGEYNQRLYRREIGVENSEQVEENGYYDLLNIMGSGIMGYVEIPSIDVYLPIYHGIDDTEMGLGAGHMPQSSLPVGGENTHAVLSAHTGQASNPLFTDLPTMKQGDIFYIHILTETLTYQVAETMVVEPWEINAVQIEQGKDYVSLLTCYPYPTLSKRFIVKGERVETVEEPIPEETYATEPEEETPSLFYSNYLLGICIGALAFLVILFILTVCKLVVNLRAKNGGRYEKK